MKDALNALKNFFFPGTPACLRKSTLSAEQIRGYNHSREAVLQHSFCLAPSANMLFAQDGSVRVCCHNLEHVIGRFPEQTIDEIWSSEKAKELRHAMKEYNLSKGCRVCQRDVEIGAYAEATSRHFDSLPAHRSYPVMMEFLLSNICNLECTMCQGDFSSLIRKNREKLPPLKSPYGKDFIEQVKPYLKNLHEVRFSGAGEAFAIEIYYELWEFLIRENPRCKIVIQTNGTILNKRVKDLLEKGNFQIGVSLDSLRKERFESIRINASLEKVLENIQYFSAYSSRHHRMFLIALCVMRENWDELPSFIHFCAEKNAYAKFHQVHSPEHLALPTLPAEKLFAIHRQLAQTVFPGSGNFLFQRNAAHFTYFTNVIKGWAEKAAALSGEGQSRASIHEYESALQRELAKVENKFTPGEMRLFGKKFELVLEKFNEEEQKGLLYRQALKIPPDLLVSAMLKYPDEYLLSEAANIFKI